MAISMSLMQYKAHQPSLIWIMGIYTTLYSVFKYQDVHTQCNSLPICPNRRREGQWMHKIAMMTSIYMNGQQLRIEFDTTNLAHF